MARNVHTYVHTACSAAWAGRRVDGGWEPENVVQSYSDVQCFFFLGGRTVQSKRFSAVALVENVETGPV